MNVFQKLRQAFWQRFLPEYCRQTLLERNAALERQVMDLQHKNAVLHAQLDALEYAMRVLRRPPRITVEREK